jgi:branched-chain amino acid transport system substrate-binding protein
MYKSILFTIVIALAAFPGCSKKGPESIDIGIVLSLTGDGADYGKRSLNGVVWAIEKINANNGINGKPIKLHIEDTKSSPKDAVSAINKLITIDRVRIIVGDIISGTTLAMAQIAERNSVLLLAPGASNPAMTKAGDFIFRNWTSDEFDGKAMANYAYQKGISSAAMVVQNAEYPVGLADAFQKEFERLDGRIVIREEFETGQKDLRVQLSKVVRRGATVVYVAAYSEGTGYVLKQSYELGFLPVWLSSLTVDTPVCRDIAGPLRNGVVFSTPAFNPDDTSTVVAQFVRGFKERFNDVPEVSSGHGYDAIMLLSAVMQKVGVEPTAIRDELYQTKDFHGVTGLTSFDKNGDVKKNIFIKQFVKGEAVTIETLYF